MARHSTAHAPGHVLATGPGHARGEGAKNSYAAVPGDWTTGRDDSQKGLRHGFGGRRPDTWVQWLKRRPPPDVALAATRMGNTHQGKACKHGRQERGTPTQVADTSAIQDQGMGSVWWQHTRQARGEQALDRRVQYAQQCRCCCVPPAVLQLAGYPAGWASPRPPEQQHHHQQQQGQLVPPLPAPPQCRSNPGGSGHLPCRPPPPYPRPRHSCAAVHVSHPSRKCLQEEQHTTPPLGNSQPQTASRLPARA
jgi:hypothetical protein